MFTILGSEGVSHLSEKARKVCADLDSHPPPVSPRRRMTGGAILAGSIRASAAVTPITTSSPKNSEDGCFDLKSLNDLAKRIAFQRPADQQPQLESIPGRDSEQNEASKLLCDAFQAALKSRGLLPKRILNRR